MITIDCQEAIRRLQAVKAPLAIGDNGIWTKRGANWRLIVWQDALGSLVSRDAVNAEAIYWQNKNQRG